MVSLNPNVEAASSMSLQTSIISRWRERFEEVLVWRTSTYLMTKRDWFGEARVSIPLCFLRCFLSRGSQLMSIISFETCLKGDRNSIDYSRLDSSVLSADGVCSPAVSWLFRMQDEFTLWLHHLRSATGVPWTIALYLPAHWRGCNMNGGEQIHWGTRNRPLLYSLRQ